MNYTTRYKLKAKKVGIHYTIFELIHNIKREIEQYNTGRDENTPPIYVSDRRWKKIVGLLRTSAYLNESPGNSFLRLPIDERLPMG